MSFCTSKFHPCQHFLTITPTKGSFCLFVCLIFGSFEAECWLIGAVAHIYSIDSKMKHVFQLTGCPCLCLDLPSLKVNEGWKACPEPCLMPCGGGMVHLCVLSSIGHNILRLRRVPSLPGHQDSSATPWRPSKRSTHKGVIKQFWRAEWHGFCHDVAEKIHRRWNSGCS